MSVGIDEEYGLFIPSSFLTSSTSYEYRNTPDNKNTISVHMIVNRLIESLVFKDYKDTFYNESKHTPTICFRVLV
jgi:hypothetical protein